MTAHYERFASPQDVLTRAAELSASTYVVDVEPLVASWRSGQEQLDDGVARAAGQLCAIAGARVVCFATNSARRPAATPACSTARVLYVASARKPLATGLYRNLPRPGVVIGDQIGTDGVLARRLDFTFLHYCPEASGMPFGPRLLRRCGLLLLPVLFPGRDARSGTDAPEPGRLAAKPGLSGGTYLVLHHESGATSSATLTLSAPDAAGGFRLEEWGEHGISTLPEAADAVAALRVALGEVAVNARSGTPAHPCDVTFGRSVTRVLAAAERYLEHRRVHGDRARAG